jgi:hypothetical protein
MVSAMCVFAEGEKIARHFNPYNNRVPCGYYTINAERSEAVYGICHLREAEGIKNGYNSRSVAIIPKNVAIVNLLNGH